MLKVRFSIDEAAWREYEDIWDVDIDALAVSGIDFFSQTPRQASFNMMVDSWIRTNIIEPVQALRFKYLPWLVEILRDGEVLFAGFTKSNNEAEDRGFVQTIRIDLYDPLYVISEHNDDLSVPNDSNIQYDVVSELERSFAAMIANCEEVFRGRISYVNDYSTGPDSMQLTVYYPLFDWSRSQDGGSVLYSYEHHKVVRQSIVGYVNDDDELIMEYVLYDRNLNIQTQPGSLPYFWRERVIWKKYRVDGTELIEISNTERNRYGNGALLIVGDVDWDNVVNEIWVIIAGQAQHAIDGLTIAPEDGNDSWSHDGNHYVLVDGAFTVRMAANELFYTDPDRDETNMNDWMGGLLRLICAYIIQQGTNLVMRDRLSWPDNPTTVLSAAEIIGGVQIGAVEDSNIEADFSFIKDGQYLTAGVKDFYQNNILQSMPKTFRMTVGGVNLAPGELVEWNGWRIMVMSVKANARYPEAMIEGVGRR